jgi:hypothetical protein
MASSRTHHYDRQTDHSRAESRTSDDAAEAGKSAHPHFLTGQDVAAIAVRHHSTRPSLDPLSATAVTGEPDQQAIAIDSIEGDAPGDDPGATLWATLEAAPENGITVRELINSTKMGRTWIYSRLQEHAAAGQVTQITCGRWIIDGARTERSMSDLSARTSANHCVPPRAGAQAGRPPGQTANGRSRTNTHATSDIEGYVRCIVDMAPPLTEAQRARLTALLRPPAAPDQTRHQLRRATTDLTARGRRLEHQESEAPRPTVDQMVVALEQHT